MESTLFLIPTFLGDSDPETVFPNWNLKIIGKISIFVVENEKTARRFLHKMMPKVDLNVLEFYTLNKKTTAEEIFDLIRLFDSKKPIGLMSEAGLPAVADPGSNFVKVAHQKNYKVKPLIGPSSIFLALMASGLNGQNFAFHGYVPIDKNEKNRFLKKIAQQSRKDNSAHIFMETPYRNNQILETILKTVDADFFLCIASNITTEKENIQTKEIDYWRSNMPDLNKVPTLFILQA